MKYKIPENIKQQIDRYVNDHIAPNSAFLNNVFFNDMREAISFSTQEERASLGDIALYMFNEAPAVCWGSYELAVAWVDQLRGEASCK